MKEWTATLRAPHHTALRATAAQLTVEHAICYSQISGTSKDDEQDDDELGGPDIAELEKTAAHLRELSEQSVRRLKEITSIASLKEWIARGSERSARWKKPSSATTAGAAGDDATAMTVTAMPQQISTGGSPWAFQERKLFCAGALVTGVPSPPGGRNSCKVSSTVISQHYAYVVL